jgi:hypothetical protein
MQRQAYFRVMQVFCFYPNATTSLFSGNAGFAYIQSADAGAIIVKKSRNPRTNRVSAFL